MIASLSVLPVLALPMPFGAARTVTTSADGARSVFAADVDGDGDVDLLSASELNDTIVWHENTAEDGSAWTARTITAAADGAASVFAADVDGDGDLDILSASSADDTIAWHENTAGDGSTWTAHTITAAADGATSVFAADVDGDGDLDVLSASESDDTIAWHENTAGDGSAWTAHTITTAAGGARSVFAVDVDGDGDLDALSASYSNDTIAWHENTAGDGSTWTAHTITTAADGATSVFAADVDGDGHLDVLSASELDDTIAWHENTAGDGSAWTAHTITAAAGGARSVFAVDVDGDGDLDALSASYLDDTIEWHESTAGNGLAWTAHTITTTADGASYVYAADVDGDGDLDSLSASFLDDTIAWYENGESLLRGSTTGEARAITILADGTTSVFAADVDGDGDADSLSASSADDTIAWHENTAGDGSAWTAHTITTAADNASSVFAADVDGDGDLDALAGSEHTITWHENDGTPGGAGDWTEHVITPLAQGARSVFAADVDGDGDVDALSASAGSDTIEWHENTVGDGSVWTAHPIWSAAAAARSVFAADVDGDGDLDALSASEGDDTIRWYENTVGDGSTWSAHTITTAAAAARSVFAADVDGDGDLDALSASYSNDTIAWHENTAGDGSAWTARTIASAADGATSVFAADVDGDGDLDALSASYSDNTIAWHENDGAPGGAGDWTEHEITSTAPGAQSVFAADVDGDGDPDVLSASATDDTIAWYPNRRAVFAFDETAWTSMVGGAQRFDTTVANVALADEVSSPPGPDTGLGPTLTWGAANTGLCRTFELQALDTSDIRAMTFDDDEGSAAWDEAISIGDIGDFQDDDFEITLETGPPLRGFGFHLLDNAADAGESYTVQGSDGRPLAMAPGSEIPDSSGDGTTFVGVITQDHDPSIAGVVFDEDDGPDDIGLLGFRFQGVDADGDGYCLETDCDDTSTACTDSPLSYWRFDEGSGSTALDSYGDSDGTIVGATYVTGVAGTSLRFDGLDDYVETPLDAQPSALPYTTWTAWVRPTRLNHGAWQIVLGNDDGGWDRFVGIPPGTSNFGVSTGSGYWEPASAAADIWQFVAVVLTPDSIAFYKDGARYDWDGTPAFGTTTRTFEVGRNVSGLYFAGDVDEVTVYDRALTDAEIQSIYLGGADATSCRDADGDGVQVCDGDCDETNPHCTSDCTDADADGYCVTSDCDDTSPDCNFDCTDADGDGMRTCDGDCDETNPNCTTNCTDADGDGYCITNDCNDVDPNNWVSCATCLDGDGDLDLVVGNSGQPNRLYLNDGTGGFSAGSNISDDSQYTLSAVLGDVDGDGDLDLVVGNNYEPNRLYLNDGTGSFGAGSDITADAHSTRSVVLGDVDGDGDLDLVAGNYGQPNRLHLNDGTGNFSAGSNISDDSQYTLSAVLGDVDRDGDLDLVVGNSGQPNRLYLNDGTGGFSAGSNITDNSQYTTSVVLGDVDGDGDLDLVEGNDYEPNLLYLNDGTGGFSAGSNISDDSHPTWSAVLGDVDRNGALDLVVGNRYGQPNRLYYGTGTGSFTAGSNITDDSHDTYAIALGDVSGDGDLDLVAGNYHQPNRLYLNNGYGSFAAGSNITDDSQYTTSVVLGDLDGDGDGFYVGCDRYLTIPGPDCDPTNPSCTSDCTDADGDGVRACDGDCDDTKPGCTTDCTDTDSDGLCVTHDCDDTNASCMVSPLSYWRFDEGSGSTAQDFNGSNHGTIVGATYVTGVAETSLRFDGLDDYVETPLDAQPSALPYTTWTAWVRPTRLDHGAWQMILDTDDGGWDRFLGIPPWTSNFGVSTGSGYWEPAGADADQWQFVAVVFTPGSIVFYKDGTRYPWGGTPSFGPTTQTFQIGQNQGSLNRFAGDVDEVTVYDRALTDAEVQSIYVGGADALSCSDADSDGVRGCDGDCAETNPDCGTDCTDADSDGICATLDCDDETPSAGSTVFPEMITAASPDALVWATAMDVRWCKGDLTGVDDYTTDDAGSIDGATSLDISMDSPAPGSGMYYMVREQGCGSWQTSPGAEPGRDAHLPLP